MKPFVIGVAGGSGSGKTTIAKRLLEQVDETQVTYLLHDSYYRDQSHLPAEDRNRLNYDHPFALETDLLVRHLRKLKEGKAVEIPRYDFKTHTRLPEGEIVKPTKIVVVDGILILENAALRAEMDIKLFVDTSADVRFIRRLQRDIAERGRDVQSVIDQYLSTVRPMHDEFVETSKRHADIIIPAEEENTVAVEMVAARVNWMLKHEKEY